MEIPTLRSPRLVLRPFTREDSARVEQLAGAWEVAHGTLTIPHPYEAGMAEGWINGHAKAWEEGHILPLAVTTEADGVIGSIGLQLTPEHRRAELGYWIGVPYWNRGYATEAAAALVDYAFTDLRLHKIVARHFTRNPASGRVLTKLGMRHEGTMRQHVERFGQFEDLECYAVLEADWRQRG